MREIKLLKCMNHPNVIGLLEIKAPAPNIVYLVFEYLDFDLSGMLQYPHFRPSVPQIKAIIQQILEALAYVHSKGIVHRDLKGSNVLISRSGVVKLADFGLAKAFIHPDSVSPSAEIETQSRSYVMTNRVVTLWYRPPEILLGSISYGPEIDIWGAGCILLELLGGRPAFPGQDEIGQLEAITSRLGPLPNTAYRSYSDCYPWLQMIGDVLQSEPHSPSSPRYDNFLQDEFGDRLGKEGLELITAMLQMDPTKRILANAALSHPWFKTNPQPSELPEITVGLEGDWHDFESRQRSKSKPSSTLNRTNQ